MDFKIIEKTKKKTKLYADCCLKSFVFFCLEIIRR